jgi:peptidoglycan-N-acetylglucosamine deacetylase
MNPKHQTFSTIMSISWIVIALTQLIACKNERTFSTDNTPAEVSGQAQYQTTNDSLLAAAERKDTVNVFAKIPKTSIDSNSKVIYMTFDDGPLSPTPYLTQIITDKQIKISEFAVGKHALANKTFMSHLDAMKRNPYIEVLNHSYSHAYHKYKDFYSRPQSAAKDMMDNEENLGLTAKIVRMPGRDIWATPNIRRNWSQSGGSTAAILLENGYRVYGWDMEWEHYTNTLPKQTPAQIVSQIDYMFNNNKTQTPNHLVFLGHDEMLVKEKGRQDLRQIIDMLKSRGYIFEFISYYPL